MKSATTGCCSDLLHALIGTSEWLPLYTLTNNTAMLDLELFIIPKWERKMCHHRNKVVSMLSNIQDLINFYTLIYS